VLYPTSHLPFVDDQPQNTDINHHHQSSQKNHAFLTYPTFLPSLFTFLPQLASIPPPSGGELLVAHWSCLPCFIVGIRRNRIRHACLARSHRSPQSTNHQQTTELRSIQYRRGVTLVPITPNLHHKGNTLDHIITYYEW